MKNTITIFEHFKNNGYEVLGTGKLHHGGHAEMAPFKNDLS